MHGVAHTGRENLGPEHVVVVDPANLLDQLNAIAGNIVEPADKWAHVVRTCLGGEERLPSTKDQGAVGANALVREIAQGLDAVFDHGHLHDNVFVEGGQGLPFLDHLLKIGTDDFSTHIAIGNVADVYVVLAHCSITRDAFLGHQAGVGGHTVEDAEGFGFADLVEVGGIDEELHGEGL